MKALVQRVTQASIAIDGKTHASIGNGLLVLLGIHKLDTEADIDWMARKIVQLRVFENGNGQMNEDLSYIDGEVMVVSQFTLLASNRKGNRPSFNDAAPPAKGKADYEALVEAIAAQTGKPPQTGVFAADMQVSLVNDGPVTILLDSMEKA